MKSIIHVNRQNIAMNSKDGRNRPVFTCKQGRRTIYAREVHINGPSVMIAPGTALSCGAKAWIETDSDVSFVDPMTFQESRNV